MNSSIIRYILGHVMRMEACFLLLPCIVSLVYGEGVGLYYLGTAIVSRLGYYREETRLRGEIDRYRAEYEENTRRLNELAVDSGAIEKIAREKYLMKKPNEDIYVFQEDIEE